MVVGHAGAVQSFEVLPLLQKDFQAVLFHTLVVDQLHLQQAGWAAGRQATRQKGKEVDHDFLHSYLMLQEEQVHCGTMMVALFYSSCAPKVAVNKNRVELGQLDLFL